MLIPVLEPLIAPPSDWSSAGWGLLLEVLTGGILGWSAALIIAGARLAGELVAAQAGLSTATLFDPETGEEIDRTGPALRLDRAGGVSGARWPADPGSCVGRELSGRAGRPALDLAGDRGAGLRAGRPCPGAVAPSRRAPALALTLAGIVLGWLSRAAPSLPFVALALPIRSVLGVVLIMLSLATLVATLAGAWDTFPF